MRLRQGWGLRVLTTLWGPVGLCLTVLVCLSAAALGGVPERRGAGPVALSGGAAFLAATVFGQASAALVLGPLDLLAMWPMFRLTWRSGRVWPTWAVFAQGLAVAVHLTFASDPGTGAEVWLRALGVAHTAVLAALGYGLVEARRAKRTPKPEPEPDPARLHSRL